MSTAATSGPFEIEGTRPAEGLHLLGTKGVFAAEVVRRRGSQAQGRALERIGHAVEYLVDSRLFQVGDHNQRDEQEAVQILMRLSRAVFAECPEVVSLRKRLKRWLVEHVVRDAQAA